MAKSTTFANDWLLLILNATPITGLARDAAAPNASVYVSLHTATPGVGGDQTTNESAYGNYARIAVARTSSGWTVAGGTATNAALVQFAAASGSATTLTHVAIGTNSSGVGKVLWAGALNASLAILAGTQPQFTTGQLSVTES